MVSTYGKLEGGFEGRFEVEFELEDKGSQLPLLRANPGLQSWQSKPSMYVEQLGTSMMQLLLNK